MKGWVFFENAEVSEEGEGMEVDKVLKSFRVIRVIEKEEARNARLFRREDTCITIEAMDTRRRNGCSIPEVTPAEMAFHHVVASRLVAVVVVEDVASCGFSHHGGVAIDDGVGYALVGESGNDEYLGSGLCLFHLFVINHFTITFFPLTTYTPLGRLLRLSLLLATRCPWRL